MADTDQAPGAGSADPITPPPSDGAATDGLEQASPASDGATESPASSDQAPPDPDAERIAWLKSLPPSKLLELHEDLARSRQDEINKGVQRTLAKQQAADQRKRDAEAAVQAAAAARAQREADRQAKRDLWRKGQTGEYETVEQLSKERLEQLEQEAFGADQPDLEAYARQVEVRTLQETTDKVVAELRTHPIARDLSEDEFTRIFQQDNYGKIAVDLALANGWLEPSAAAEREKAWEQRLKSEVEAAVTAARAELNGDAPEHALPRGVGGGTNGATMTWGALQGMPLPERIKWRDTHPAQYDALTAQLART